MRILFVDKVHPILEERFVASGWSTAHDYSSDHNTVQAKLAQFDGLVIRSRIPVDRALLSAAPHLKFIARSGAGLENIDLQVAQELNIQVFNSPEGNRDAVGEHAIGMLLMYLNNLKRADAEVRIGRWRREANRGSELGALTVGIIGYGNTGQSFARKLSGFGCKVLAYDKYHPQPKSQYAKDANLHELQQHCDVISLHVPLADDTRYMVDATFIAKMQKPFILINTARGPVVNTEALMEGIKEGKVSGACLDVLEFEEGSFEGLKAEELPEAYHRLCHSDKVLLSPHIAGWTYESLVKLSSVLADKILAHFKD